MNECMLIFISLNHQQVTFCVYGSVHRWSVLVIVQRDATQSSLFIILQVHSTCFGCQPHPTSGVHKTVTTASGTVQLPPSNVAKLAWPRWREVAAQKIWSVPEAVVTVLCTPNGGCGWHPKHVEWTCRIINRLLCVASRWTIFNIDHILYTVLFYFILYLSLLLTVGVARLARKDSEILYCMHLQFCHLQPQHFCEIAFIKMYFVCSSQ